MARWKRPAIWAMESKWSPSVRDVRSVTPVLNALQAAGAARYAHVVINSPEDFDKQLKRLGQKQHEDFTIGYIAMHGSPGKVYTGRKSIDLVSTGQKLPSGALKKKVLHFGSCSVLTDEDQQQELLKALGAKAITGFTKDVDWMECLAFELLLFSALSYYQRSSYAETYIRKHHGEFAERLGFVMVR
ncbi:DUF6642 family protein [Janibacter indicus]|uniref:CHAT domain-containing protein n=1 Tax=Janibacter indicus TaxID=857417 RepID=A0A1W2A815_9MICO|nr:hypothetical protein SAMN06296429_105140 [Janibacter indicus]